MRNCAIPCRDPVRCLRCGHLAERSWLHRPEYTRRTLRGTRHLAPGDCCPDEFVTVCPDCQAVEPFDDAILCAECLRYPCVCDAGERSSR
jgi:hypothetical protein